MSSAFTSVFVLLDFALTVKAAPHECVIRTSQPYASVKAEKEAWFYSKVTVPEVECLTRDREAAGSSLTGVTALWSLSKAHLS